MSQPADPYDGRQPTSHERLAGEPWDASYIDGPAPWDVDVAETALSIAREKAAARGIRAEFMLADALHLDRLGRVFETVLDCGLLHTLDRDERQEYVAGLASVTSRGGSLYVLCFSDLGPDTGPHPISEEELTATFTHSGGWSVASVSPDLIQTRFSAHGASAWLAKIVRQPCSASATRTTRYARKAIPSRRRNQLAP
jgi:ubiquinone/menaquinone biosynthesis C-methylase UbiE